MSERERKAIHNAFDYVGRVLSFCDVLDSSSMRGYSSEKFRDYILTRNVLKARMGLDLSDETKRQEAIRNFLQQLRQVLLNTGEGRIATGNESESAINYFHILCEDCLDEGGREYMGRIDEAQGTV